MSQLLREVPLDGGFVARVRPIGLRHVEQFGSQVAGLFGVLSPMLGGVKDAKDIDPERMQALLIHVVPYALKNMLGIVRECVVIVSPEAEALRGKKLPKGIEPPPEAPAIEDLPHWELPPIIEAWLMLSFDEERKWRPWLAAIENLIGKVTGGQFSITSALSRFSSPQTTPDTTSKTEPALAGLTTDGA